MRRSRPWGWVVAVELMGLAATGFAQGPPPLPPPPVPPQNPITEPKRVLGKILFWEEQLSSDNSMSCGTCHQSFRSATDPRPAVHPGLDAAFGSPDDVLGSFGVERRDATGAPVSDPIFGFDRQVTRRSAQTVYGSLWSPQTFWDGRAGPAFVDPQTGATVIPVGGALEAQAIGPILSDNEMAREGRTWTDVATKLQTAAPLGLATYLTPDVSAAIAANPDYPALFNAAFGTPAITAQRIAFAIATYERTLVTNQTPFDLGTLTPQQQQGFNVFQNPASACAVCHTPPIFTNNTFRNIGLRPIGEDTGRQEVTGNAADAGRFKVPSLRNVGLKSFFMHNGRRSTLEEVVDFYIPAGGQVQFPANQDPLIPPINIPPGPRLDLIEFLRDGLTDPRVAAEAPPFDRPILLSERGDADRDGDVDVADRASFEICYTGQDAGPVPPECQRLDMDGDADVACDDWESFKLVWTDPTPPDEFATCAAMLPPPALIWDPDESADTRGTRSLTVSATAATATGSGSAIRVRMIDLQNPSPANPPCCPPPNFGAFESSTCSVVGEGNGCVRWVGPPVTVREAQDNLALGAYMAARLQCSPFYADWTALGSFVIVGPEIMPSSTFELVAYGSSCKGLEASCTDVSPPVTAVTRRSGDVSPPYAPTGTQPDPQDVVAVLNKFRNQTGAPGKATAQIQPNVLELNVDVGALDIVATIDAFRGTAYPFSGPCACPSLVTCNATVCTSANACSGGLCVRTCTGGASAGQPCLTDTHCPSSTCGAGFCRDRCGRCAP